MDCTKAAAFSGLNAVRMALVFFYTHLLFVCVVGGGGEMGWNRGG